MSVPGCRWEDSALERLCLARIAFGVCGFLHLCPQQPTFSLLLGGGVGWASILRVRISGTLARALKTQR